MTPERDPLIDAIRAAGAVPPAPARDEAFARAMRAAGDLGARRRMRRGVIALFAAAMLGAPAGVFAAHTFHKAPATVPAVGVETPDPGSSIARETSDRAEPRETERADDHSGSGSDDNISGTEQESGDDGTTSNLEGGSDDSGSDRSGDSSSSGDGEEATASSTPSSGSDSDDGSSLSGGDGVSGADSSSSDGGTDG